MAGMSAVLLLPPVFEGRDDRAAGDLPPRTPGVDQQQVDRARPRPARRA
jgi:hypothetical protein